MFARAKLSVTDVGLDSRLKCNCSAALKIGSIIPKERGSFDFIAISFMKTM